MTLCRRLAKPVAWQYDAITQTKGGFVPTDDSSRDAHGSGLPRDVSEDLRLRAERYELAARGANDGLWDWDIPTGLMYYSPRWKEMLGFEECEISDSPDEWFERIHPEDIQQLRESRDLHLRHEMPHLECEYRIRMADGNYRWMLCRGAALFDDAGTAIRMAGSQTDITERKLAIEELLRNALHDALTGLPNRRLFLDRLEGAANRARRHPGTIFAVLYLDLDNFKSVNDSFGHAAGDALLVEVSRRIASCLRPSDTVARASDILARLGGDEFTVLVEDMREVSDAIRVAERIQDVISMPVVLGEYEILTGASIGIAVSTTGFERADELLRDADAAMYRAKSLGKGGYSVCDGEQHAQAIQRLELESELRRAVKNEQMVLLYQPIVELESGRIVGFEALLRWPHPTRGLLVPADFLHIANESDVLRPLSDWVLASVCSQLKHWQSVPETHDLTVSINVAERQLGFHDFFDELAALLTAGDIDGSRLLLDISSSSLTRAGHHLLSHRELLSHYGIAICVDDFGTGPLPLSLLEELRVHSFKVDLHVVAGIGTDEGRARARRLVQIAAAFGVPATAEGLEDSALRHAVTELGFSFAQGFSLQVPVASGEAKAMVDRVF
ncbi:MAG: EAL domain-containing protein [Acidobacteria bacterium]|nr:EAL domain-containing protein [Acidobacteriota bacterium]